MASVVIPSNPQINDTVVLPNKTIKWNGSVWVAVYPAASGGGEEAVAAHSAVTTSVHGIEDTALLATKAYADSAAAAIVDAAPATLNTLNELAAALGDDANFATTVTNTLTAKANSNAPTISNPTFQVSSSSVFFTDPDFMIVSESYNGGLQTYLPSDSVLPGYVIFTPKPSVPSMEQWISPEHYYLDGTPISDIAFTISSAERLIGTTDCEIYFEPVNTDSTTLSRVLAYAQANSFTVVPITISIASTKTITPANIGHLDAPTITNPAFNVEIASVSGSYSADEIINPSISGSIKLATYSSTAYEALIVGTFIKLVNSTSGTENVDNLVFEVVENAYDAVFDFYYVRLLAVDSANYSAVDSWITSVYANGTSGMTFGVFTSTTNSITPTELSYLDGVTSNIQTQINTIAASAGGGGFNPFMLMGA